MAFKPMIVTKEINGTEYTAQFNGMSARNEIVDLSSEGVKKATPYLFENVLVTPKISDIDEYFGFDTDTYDKVVEFLLGVATANKKYFPVADEKAVAEKGRK